MYRPKLISVVRKYVKDEDTIEELLQKSFIKIYEKLKSYEFIGSFEGWICMITRNLVIDHIRRKDPLLHSSEIIDNVHLVSEDVNLNELEIEFENKINAINECIDLLTPAYKDCFIMYVINECSHKEIAESLGISVGCSKSNLFKAKNKIRKLLLNKLI